MNIFSNYQSTHEFVCITHCKFIYIYLIYMDNLYIIIYADN